MPSICLRHPLLLDLCFSKITGTMLTMLTLEVGHYHHGNLKVALVKAGLKKVERHGLNSLSLRPIAQSVGVSASALYRHFSDLEHLKAAVSQAAREELGEMMLKAIEATSASKTSKSATIARFMAIGDAYIDFGVQKSNLFEIAFLCCQSSDLEEDSPNPWKILMGSLEELHAIGALTNKNFADAPTIAWSSVHGFASLSAQGATGNRKETALAQRAVMKGILKALEID